MEKGDNHFVPKYEFKTILSIDIYVALEQELCLPSRSEYIRLIAISLDLPSEYD